MLFKNQDHTDTRRINMKEFAVGVRADGSKLRIEGKSIEQSNELEVIVDGVKITFGECIERIEERVIVGE